MWPGQGAGWMWLLPVLIVIGAAASLQDYIGKEDFRSNFEKSEYTQYYNSYLQFRWDDTAYPVVVEIWKTDDPDPCYYIYNVYFEDGYMVCDKDGIRLEDLERPLEIRPYGAYATLDIGKIADDQAINLLPNVEIEPFERAKMIGYDFFNDGAWWVEVQTGLLHHENCQKMSGYCEFFGNTIDELDKEDFCSDCLKLFEQHIEEDGWWH